MLFNSAEFLVLFLPLTLITFYLALRIFGGVAASSVLLVASLIFYSYWDIRYLALLLASITTNYLLGVKLRNASKKSWLVTGVAFNLCLIAFFKYTNWFIDTTNVITGSTYPLLNIALPLGISFFTFQQIAYLVDCYHGKFQHKHTFSRYALFVGFFPQLIAGPIVRSGEMIPQFDYFHKQFSPTAEQVARGLLLIMLGLFKKLIIADWLAHYVDPAFSQVNSLSSYDAWVATFGYSFQLYFDFSAYCEMAMGIALLFGITLPLNFNSPYKAKNIQDFWRRWHITLGRFLRDYLYIPLGGNRKGGGRTVAALMITMLLGGLWHGAGWNFILWGAMHGVFLGTFFLWRRTGISLPTPMAQVITLLCVMVAWTMFRCTTVEDALIMYDRMFTFDFSLPMGYLTLFPFLGDIFSFKATPFYTGMEVIVIISLFAMVTKAKNVHEIASTMQPNWRYATATGFIALITAFNLGAPSSFLYWQF